MSHTTNCAVCGDRAAYRVILPGGHQLAPVCGEHAEVIL